MRRRVKIVLQIETQIESIVLRLSNLLVLFHYRSVNLGFLELLINFMSEIDLFTDITRITV